MSDDPNTNALEAAKRRADRDHAQWSAAERQRLTGNAAAIGASIKSGAIFSLTNKDRDALVDAYGSPKLSPVNPCAVLGKGRVPQPLRPATKPVAAQQSWTQGELAHACKVAAVQWAITMAAGILAIEALWRWWR